MIDADDALHKAFGVLAILAVVILMYKVLAPEGDGHAPAREPETAPSTTYRRVSDEVPPAAGGVYIMEYEGHEYLCVRGWNQLGMAHSATCRKCNDDDKEAGK